MLKCPWSRNWFNKFCKNEDGSIKLLTAFALPVLLYITGSAVDTAEMYRARANFQIAVDAAALTTAKTLAATGDTTIAQEKGRDIFHANIANLAPSVGTVAFDLGDGNCANSGVAANGTLVHDVFFGIGYVPDHNNIEKRSREVTLRAEAVVQCGNDSIEVAMVLDNSGSMGSNGKIGTLRIAATNLVNTLHTTMANASIPDPIRFSLIPFAATVNVGAQNRNSGWMDTEGVSSIHHENFDWDSNALVTKVGDSYKNAVGASMSRFTIYDNLVGVDWNGCVEQRPYPYHTTDETPTIANPDSMFVPTFAPDTPDDWTGQRELILQTGYPQAICQKVDGGSGWKSKYKNGNLRIPRTCRRWSDGWSGETHWQDPAYKPHYNDLIEYQNGTFIGASSTTTSWVPGNLIVEERYQNNYLPDDHNYPTVGVEPSRSRNNTGTGADQYARQKWTWKYFEDSSGNRPDPRDVDGGNLSIPTVVGLPGGPNNACTTTAITDLTTSQSNVVDAISNMEAQGATNVQQGLAWGWRTLSPTKPFDNGRAYTAEDNKKILIVMTDGNNTYYPIQQFSGWTGGRSGRNKSYYGAFGHTVNERIFAGYDDIANPDHDFNTFRNAMDHHLAETCINVKQQGITVYSIAFDVPNGSSVKTMLEQCASSDVGGGKLYFDASNNAELIQTFESIAEKLADLAISH